MEITLDCREIKNTDFCNEIIDEVKIYWKVSDRPFYNEMNDDEKAEIRKYSEDMGLPYEFIKFSVYE